MNRREQSFNVLHFPPMAGAIINVAVLWDLSGRSLPTECGDVATDKNRHKNPDHAVE